MSLNWKEIDLALAELPLEGAHVQQIVQSDFRNIYLQIYRPSDRFWLRICLDTGSTRLHRAPGPAAKPGTRQRFAQLLHSRIKGARITGARQVNSDRIVRIDLVRAGEPSTLWIRLWGGAANLILTDGSGAIMDAFFRRPKRGEVSGGTYLVEDEGPRDGMGDDRFKARFPAEGINDSIEQFYRRAGEEAERTQLLGAVGRTLRQRETQLEVQIDRAERTAAEAGDADRLQLYGDLVTAALHEIDPGAQWLEATDYSDADAKITIELDPALTPAANAKRFYDRARKARRRAEGLGEELDNLRHRLEGVRARIATLEDATLDELRELSQDTDRAPKPAARSESELPGLLFTSGGFTILVGRNSRENDALLRHHVRGNDLWLHTRDFPGGYVFVRARKNKSVPLDVLLDAGNLAVHYSKAKANGRAELYYTHVKYLRRAKGAPLGTVLPTNEKNLSVVADQERLSRLLS